MSDLIDRQDAINAPEKLIKDCNPDHFVGHQKFIEFMDNAEIGSFGNWQFANGFNLGLTAAEVEIEKLPSAQQWIPIKTRPMTEDERHYFEEQVGVELSDDEAVFFDCPMPDDGQRVWVQSVNGYIWDDVCDRDDFIGLEGNGDWDTIVAWMPMIIPEQYKGIEDGKRK